jgi:hypothetical protein
MITLYSRSNYLLQVLFKNPILPAIKTKYTLNLLNDRRNLFTPQMILLFSFISSKGTQSDVQSIQKWQFEADTSEKSCQFHPTCLLSGNLCKRNFLVVS